MFLKNNYFTKDLLFYTLLTIVSSIILTISVTKNPHRTGDGHEYYMMAESFINHGSPNMTEGDRVSVENKSLKYSYKSYYIDRKNYSGYFKNFNGKYYSYHFFAYSLFTVPVKYVLNLLSVNDLQSFQITNSILFIIMVWLLYFKLQLPNTQKYALITLVIFNPVLYYLDWTHPEVFTYVFVVLSLMFINNKNYVASYVLMAIASWQNPPVIFFSLLVFLVHFFQNLRSKKYKHILLEGSALSLFLIPMIFYFYNYGVLNLIVAKGFSSIAYVSFIKVWDLYFGLQHGMILFSALIILTFIFIVIKKILYCDFNTISIIYLLSIVIMSVVVTTAPNWNCGMNYIIRYAIWIYPFIVYFIVLNSRNFRILNFIAYVNTIVFLIVFFIYSTFSYVYFNPLSKFLLSNYPSMYIVTKDTFAENILHKESNYINELPILYNNGVNVRKILTNYSSLKSMLESSKYLITNTFREELINKYKKHKNLFFINIPRGKIVRNICIKKRETITNYDDRISYINWSDSEHTHRWSLGQSSKIKFQLSAKKSFSGILKLHIGSLGKQEIKVIINGHYVGSQTFDTWDKNIFFFFDPNILHAGSNNTIEFKFSNAHKPNNGDQRVLAIALKSFKIE